MKTKATSHITLGFACALVIGLAAGAAAEAKNCPPPRSDAPAVSAPPEKFPAFYQKYVDANGIAIVGDSGVCDRSLQLAYLIVLHMLSKRPDIQQTLAMRGAHISLVSEGHNVLSTPEFATLPARDRLQCGVTGFVRNPTVALCEDNLIGFDDRSKRHVSELIHEFGHLIMNVGVDKATHDTIDAAYQHAVEQRLFLPNQAKPPSYAMSNAMEFWAMATMAWFSASDWRAPFNSDHEKNRKTQAAHDPEIDAILRQVYPEDDWDYPQR
jgi:hypothetical protein